MELFWSDDICDGICRLGEEESAHCVKVLRHREGDTVNVIDGRGSMYTCRLTDASPKHAEAVVLQKEEGWGAHDYDLTLAVCPTKNNDRYEWFAEKATEVGVDTIVPVIGEHSERKVFRTDRLRKILLSAAKQSLKGAVPEVLEPVSVKQFIASAPADAVRLIAYCFEGEMKRTSVKEALAGCGGRKIVVMIGPEGDFSVSEAEAAIAAGFIPVHLGPSRLRTETAALTAAEAVYFATME